MKTFEVVLMKSYIVTIKAEDERKAREYAEFFTGDVQDLSSDEQRQEFGFQIKNIDCRINESFDSRAVE